MNMKKTIISGLICLLPVSAFAILGLGISGNASQFIVDPSVSPLLVDNPLGGDPLEVGSFTHHGFENGGGVGFYLYVDAIPFIGLEAEVNSIFSPYYFSFGNAITSIDSAVFGFLAGSAYYTAYAKVFKLSIPILAKVQLTAGAGINQHSSIPMINQEMLEAVVAGGDIEDGALDEDVLIEYLTDNKIDASGIHIQAGLQFKILVLDCIALARYTIVEDLIPGQKGFPSLNLRIGLGF